MGKMSKSKLLALIIIAMMASGLTGCIKPYDRPEIATIEASQTAFLIPLVGNTAEQASFESEELLANAKIATKEVQIPHRWVQTGRMSWSGVWRQSAKLIIVERKPETREWTAAKDAGTNVTNQAVYAESKESIGFSVGMNCSAQVDEANAVTFLYRYNNKSLSDIMDTEIRARVESKFVEECAKFSLNEILLKKEAIMASVREDVTTYFTERGITITVLGMKDGLEYEDSAIQQSINENFSSEQKLVTQENENKRILSQAETEAQAVVRKAEAEAKSNQLLAGSVSPELTRYKQAEKWDGKLPQVQGEGTPVIDMRE